MRKYLIAAVVIPAILGGSFVLAEAVDSEFISALKNCSSYSENGVVNTEGMNVSSQKRILGKKDGKCVYEEDVKFAENNLTITCQFTKEQREEIVRVMNAYEIVQKYTNEKVDTSSYSAVEKNPVVKVWGKYLQDETVCSFK